MRKRQKNIQIDFIYSFVVIMNIGVLLSLFVFLGIHSYQSYEQIKQDMFFETDTQKKKLMDDYEILKQDSAFLIDSMHQMTFSSFSVGIKSNQYDQFNTYLTNHLNLLNIEVYENDQLIHQVSPDLVSSYVIEVIDQDYVIKYHLKEEYLKKVLGSTYSTQLIQLTDDNQLKEGHHIVHSDDHYYLTYHQKVILDHNEFMLMSQLKDKDLVTLLFNQVALPTIVALLFILTIYAYLRLRVMKRRLNLINTLVDKFKDYSDMDIEFFVNQDFNDTNVKEFHDILTYFKRFCENNKLNYDNMMKSLNNNLEAAKESSQSKSLYLANMSHEMRTPLNSVIGYSQLIDKIGYDDIEKVRDYVGRINTSSDLLLKKINDILDLAKIESNQFEIIKKPTQIKSAIKEVYELLVISAHKKGIEFNYYIDPQIPSFLMMDETRFKQIIINLCSNAIKFTEHGYVKLEIELFGYLNDAIVLDYKVTDTGCGIPSDKLDRVFIPFIQVSNQMNKGAGTGLGLTITKDLIKLMGGDIKVNSKLGVGTIFSFTTIFETCEHYQEERQESELTDEMIHDLLQTKTIMVVEDNPINQVLITEIFKVLGDKEVLIANNGFEAHEMAQSTQFDLIFMDIQMPECDGVEATKLIRGLPSYQTTPIIALTANAFSEQVTEYLSLGMNDYLKKPLDINNLKQILANYLRE